MASSRFSSNGPDAKDLLQALLNHELLAQRQITLSIRSFGSNGAAGLLLQAHTAPLTNENGEVLPSVSASATLRQLNVTTLSAAFLNLLHQLDRELWAEGKWDA